MMEAPNIKFHGKTPSGRRAEAWGQTDRQRDMAELVGAFRGCVNAPRGISLFFFLSPYLLRAWYLQEKEIVFMSPYLLRAWYLQDKEIVLLPPYLLRVWYLQDKKALAKEYS
jgi:hypothetical protein